MAGVTLDDCIFTVDEAAEFARVPASTIRRWFDEGLRHFPTCATVGARGPRREIVRKSVLLAFIESREVGATVEVVPAGKPARKPPRQFVVPAEDDPLGLMTRKKGRPAR